MSFLTTSEIRQRLREHGIGHVSTAFLLGCEYGPDVPMYRVSMLQRFFDQYNALLYPSVDTIDYLANLFPELRLVRGPYAGRHQGIMCHFCFIQPTREHTA